MSTSAAALRIRNTGTGIGAWFEAQNSVAITALNEGTGQVALFQGNLAGAAVDILNDGTGPALRVVGNSEVQPAFFARSSGAGAAGHFVGRVGIGTDSPSTQLHVIGSAGTRHITTIENTSPGSSADVLELKLPNRATPGSLNNYVTMRKGGNQVAGQIDGNAAGGVSYRSESSDFAEWLPRLQGEEEIEAGDIVGAFQGRVTKNTDGAASLHVVSSAPIVSGNSPSQEEEHLWEEVAFLGQVPVKVGGKVSAGDYIVPAGLNDGTGVAIPTDEMKLADFGRIVGCAWESSDEEDVKLVKAVVGLAHPAPDLVALLAQKEEQLKTLTAQVELLKLNQERFMRHLMLPDTE